MVLDQRGLDEIKRRKLCAACVGEPFLSAEIKGSGEPGRCSYCGQHGQVMILGEVADRIDTAFEQHYRRTSTEPSALDYAMMKDGDFDWSREGEPATYAISEATMIDDELAEDIRLILEDSNDDIERARMGEEGPYDQGAHYAEREPDDAEYREEWRNFEEHLKSEARFFSREAEATLDNIFEDLADHRSPEGKPVVVEAGPDTLVTGLYRARVFQTHDELVAALERPEMRIGPPPARVARAGRMNAHGISVFYGATNPDVAIGEVRPPVGSQVVVARFAVLREIRLLDLKALRSLYIEGSIFDPAYIRRLERAMFLGRLSELMTRPVMPGDEPLEYLITQAIAEYLAARSDPELDGILYPSVQGNPEGANIVLFRKASRVEEVALPEGIEMDVQTGISTEDGWEHDYYIWEKVPPGDPEEPEERASDFPRIIDLARHLDRDADLRNVTLRLEPEHLTVHHVGAATYDTVPHKVIRHRSEKTEPPF